MKKRCPERMIKSIDSEVLHNHAAPQTWSNCMLIFAVEILIQAMLREERLYVCCIIENCVQSGRLCRENWFLSNFWCNSKILRWGPLGGNWNIMFFRFGLDIETLCFTVTLGHGIGIWCFFTSWLCNFCWVVKDVATDFGPKKQKRKSRERWERAGLLRYTAAPYSQLFLRLFYILLQRFVVIS